jgi:hypothetical protein
MEGHVIFLDFPEFFVSFLKRRKQGAAGDSRQIVKDCGW